MRRSKSGGSYGRLYPVDLRLRPDGSQGAVVTTVEGFDAYYEARARPFERLALRRARPIGGGAEVRAAVHRVIAARASRFDLAELRSEIQDLRRRRFEERDVSDDVKHRPAGLLDLELAIQVLHAASLRHDAGGLGHHDALDALADTGRFNPERVLRWRHALRVYRDTEVWLRLSQGADASAWPVRGSDRRAIEARVAQAHQAHFDQLWADATQATHDALAAAGLGEV